MTNNHEKVPIWFPKDEGKNKEAIKWQYLFLVIKDRSGKHPKGRVLLRGCSADDVRITHTRMLQEAKYYSPQYMSEDKCQELKSKGGVPLYKDDIIEVGIIGFDSDGNRHAVSRTRFGSNVCNNQERRKTKKLIYAQIMNHQKKEMQFRATLLQRESSDDIPFIAYAPKNTSVQQPTIYLLKRGEKITDFVEKNGLDAHRVLTVGLLGKDKNNPQRTVVTDSSSMPSYAHTEEKNKQLAVQKIDEQKAFMNRLILRTHETFNGSKQ